MYVKCKYSFFLRQRIASIDGLKVMGTPYLSVVAFQTEGPLKVYAVGDLLSRKGWHLNMLQKPQAVHIACTYLTISSADQLVADLKEAVTLLKKDPSAGNGELAAIYGTAANVPDRTLICDVTRGDFFPQKLNMFANLFYYAGFLDALTLL
jgi:sphinganine-1-phosphate aldolase